MRRCPFVSNATSIVRPSSRFRAPAQHTHTHTHTGFGANWDEIRKITAEKVSFLARACVLCVVCVCVCVHLLERARARLSFRILCAMPNEDKHKPRKSGSLTIVLSRLAWLFGRLGFFFLLLLSVQTATAV